MLTISKPLSAGQAQAYHAKEFTNAEQGYYSQQGQIHGEWHGRLAAEWGRLVYVAVSRGRYDAQDFMHATPNSRVSQRIKLGMFSCQVPDREARKIP